MNCTLAAEAEAAALQAVARAEAVTGLQAGTAETDPLTLAEAAVLRALAPTDTADGAETGLSLSETSARHKEANI